MGNRTLKLEAQRAREREERVIDNDKADKEGVHLQV